MLRKDTKEITKEQHWISNHENYNIRDKNTLNVTNARWDTSEAKVSKLECIAKQSNQKWTKAGGRGGDRMGDKWRKHQWSGEGLQAAKSVGNWSSLEYVCLLGVEEGSNQYLKIEGQNFSVQVRRQKYIFKVPGKSGKVTL